MPVQGRGRCLDEHLQANDERPEHPVCCAVPIVREWKFSRSVTLIQHPELGLNPKASITHRGLRDSGLRNRSFENLPAVTRPCGGRERMFLCQQPFVGDGREGVGLGVAFGAALDARINAVRNVFRRASSRFSRARFGETSGYAPRVSSFSTPPWRYLKRHRRPPAGVTNMKSPRSWWSL